MKGSRLTRAILFFSLFALLPISPSADPLSREFDGSVGFNGRQVFEAFALAWPGRFSKVERLDGDWAVRLDDQWFSWSGGRLLPLGVKDEMSWSPWPFYSYPAALPPVRKLDASERQALEKELARKDASPEHRDSAFFNLLFHAPDHEGAWDRMKTILLFGQEVLVNPDILEELSAVERDIRADATTDPVVAGWIRSIGHIDGFAWRSIAGTASRSMHSYGMAIDIVPARSRGLAWYWLDARNMGIQWYDLPRSQRIAVPLKVIQAFERRGFVWGGKWFYWDLVHFEYRPDILILNGMSVNSQESID
ncbi:MAG TPA: M15 family metallopeptidase [Rectinemataceae bacterium]|nr:M15 family metallopeptidase [Rectinemataceae bacterium]